MSETDKRECEATGNTLIRNEPLVCADITPIVGIYGFQNKLFPNKWNIGQSWDINKRWNYYKLGLCKGQPKFYNALKKYGYDGFEKRIIEMCDENVPQEMLDKKEIAWIKHYNSIENGYNLKEGGSHGKHSAESKLKMSKSQVGRIVLDETKEKIKNSMLGRVCSQKSIQRLIQYNKTRTLSKETRQKMADARMGKPMSDITKSKISKSRTGIKRTDEVKRLMRAGCAHRKKPVQVFDTNERLIETIVGINDAAKKYGVARTIICDIIYKRKKSWRGLTFKL